MLYAFLFSVSSSAGFSGPMGFKGLTLDILLQKAWEGIKEPVFSSDASSHSVMLCGLHHCHHYPGKLFSKEFQLYFHVFKVPTFLYKFFSLYLLLNLIVPIFRPSFFFFFGLFYNFLFSNIEKLQNITMIKASLVAQW